MKIFTAGLVTETNTFSPLPTSLSDFRVQRGIEKSGNASASAAIQLWELWGQAAQSAGHTVVVGPMAWAQPAGTTVRSAYETLRNEILDALRATLPVDIVLLMLHGAMVAQGYEDCEQDTLERVREIVGPLTVVGVELDLHCHLTESTIAPADVVITFKEYPHVDVHKRASELLNLCVATKERKVNPTMALFDCRMVGAYPTTQPAMRRFVEDMQRAEQRRKGILSLSFAHGFPYADIPVVGAKFLAVTDGDRALAAETAREFGLRAYELRREIGFQFQSVPMEYALTRALASERRPVVVADQSDNVGGGAPGDSTFALRWLLERGASDVAIGILYDPEVVRIAKRAGQGACLPVRLGGKLGPASGDPVDLKVVVLAFREGYLHPFPQSSGKPVLYLAGDVVALRSGSIDLIVSTERCQCFSPEVFLEFGIDPKHKKLLIAKSTQHFYAAFAPIAGEVIYMAAPGALSPDPRQIPYERLNTQAMFPWVDDPLGA